MVSSTQITSTHSQPVPIPNPYAGVGGTDIVGGCHVLGTPEFSQVSLNFYSYIGEFFIKFSRISCLFYFNFSIHLWFLANLAHQ